MEGGSGPFCGAGQACDVLRRVQPAAAFVQQRALIQTRANLGLLLVAGEEAQFVIELPLHEFDFFLKSVIMFRLICR